MMSKFIASFWAKYSFEFRVSFSFSSDSHVTCLSSIRRLNWSRSYDIFFTISAILRASDTASRSLRLLSKYSISNSYKSLSSSSKL